jgi:hypothetical protein
MHTTLAYFLNCKMFFMEKLGEKYNTYLLDTLISSNINENETIEDLKKIFIQIFQNLNQKIKPLEKEVCIYHFDAYYGELGFHSRKKDHQNISVAQ